MRQYNAHLTALISITTVLFLSACSPKISTKLTKEYPALDAKQAFLVIGIDETPPDDAEILGTVKIGDNGLSVNCTYEAAIEYAKIEARSVGGNAIKITEHKTPAAFGSSCHRISANILKIAHIDKHIALEEEVLQNTDYAVLNVYRYSGPGALVGFDLYLGDSVICRVKNNFKTTLYIKKDGLNTLWAKTEVKSEVPIDVKMGKTYYLRCGIVMGAFVGRPKLELIDFRAGKPAFESFKAKNK